MIGTAPPPRPHYPVAHEGHNVGEVCSRTQSPSLSDGIGRVYLTPSIATHSNQIEIEGRGRK
ncbi:MAG: glycine cleavage T C-terminal barrel domain-containing protein, partial [bacterium]